MVSETLCRRWACRRLALLLTVTVLHSVKRMSRENGAPLAPHRASWRCKQTGHKGQRCASVCVCVCVVLMACEHASVFLTCGCLSKVTGSILTWFRSDAESQPHYRGNRQPSELTETSLLSKKHAILSQFHRDCKVPCSALLVGCSSLAAPD